MFNKEKNAVIYAKCNNEKLADVKIAEQEEICRLYANEYEYTIVDTYIDKGKASNKQQLEKMIADSKEKNFDIVLVDSMDKISRSLSKFFEIEELLWKNNVVIVETRSAFNHNIPNSQDIFIENLKTLLDINSNIEEKESEEGGVTHESGNLCSI